MEAKYPSGMYSSRPRLYVQGSDGQFYELSPHVIQDIRISYDGQSDATYEFEIVTPWVDGLFPAVPAVPTTIGEFELDVEEDAQDELAFDFGALKKSYEISFDIAPESSLLLQSILEDIENAPAPDPNNPKGLTVRDPANAINPTGDFSGDTELVLEPVYALRVFDLYKSNMLHAINSGHGFWSPGENTSVHNYSTGIYGGYYYTSTYAREQDYHTFKANCTCGFWAYYNFDGEHIGAFLDKGCSNVRLSAVRDDEPRVLGVVKAYGEIVMGEKGIRAQKVEIIALCAPGGMDRYHPRMKALAENYPDVPIFFNADDMVKAFPLTEPPIGATVTQIPSRDNRKSGVSPLVYNPGRKPLIERLFK